MSQIDEYALICNFLDSSTIVYAKTVNADVPAGVRSMAYALLCSGKRWSLALRYESVIRTAISEHRSLISESSLPARFYDLRYSTLNIKDDLRAWCESGLHLTPEMNL